MYRATDRLTGSIVALKRVTMPADSAAPPAARTPAQFDALRLAMANEFQVLASLRHPNIVGVLDYGFADPADLDDSHLRTSAKHRPYFTMEYLAGARTLIEAGLDAPVRDRVELLLQLLQALTYLHRRGIVHRDLKPGNVLVVGPRPDAGAAVAGATVESTACVKVLDFGLSVSRGQIASAGGTIAYMAPEVLSGGPAAEAADLYAVGVMAYELLAGCYPFDLSDFGRLIDGILALPPDLSKLQVHDALVEVVATLMCKDPAGRFQSAEACIAAFSQALGQAPAGESAAIRESFIAAARLIGRERELECLTTALRAAIAGHGSGWLIGGESGVGKTRLLDELRTRALVAGACVLRAHAVPGGGPAYELWREPLRRLVLSTELSDLEAGILRPMVPDVDVLLGREIPEVPDLKQAGRQRLLSTMIQIFRRQTMPLLLILEDLQWASEGLNLVRQLCPLLSELPMLIVGSYRDDEAPSLPARLPGMEIIRLERLSPAEIADLSVSMLGQTGRRPEVLALLQRETEGNAFFLVEVVRALAEESGGLSQIAAMELPAQVFPSGIQTIVRRRLDRVPDRGRSLLQLAAVAGRQVDVAVLARLLAAEREDTATMSLDAWLTVCANAAVLELRDGRWRFVHEKVREGLLSTVDAGEHLALHRQVALAIEQAHPGDPEQWAALAYHWARAGDRDRERTCARLAGEHAAERFANTEALTYLGRALELTSPTDLATRYSILRSRERVYSLLGDREAQRRDLSALEELLAGADDREAGLTGRRAELSWRQAEYLLFVTDFAGSIRAAQVAVELARQAGEVQVEASACLTWGQDLWRMGDFGSCRRQLETALTLAWQARSGLPEATSLRLLGNVYYYAGDISSAGVYWQSALVISREIGDRVGEASALSNLGEGARSLGAYATAAGYYEQRLRICREIGERYGEAIALTNLSLVTHNLGRHQAAESYARQVLSIAAETGNRSQQGYALTNLGHSLAGQGRLVEADEAYRESLAVRREIGERHLAMEALAGRARVALATGDRPAALAAAGEILEFLEANSLDGTDEPLRIYLTCYQVLKAAGDPRAGPVLSTAHGLVQSLVARVSDEASRRSCIESVAYYREIESEFAGL